MNLVISKQGLRDIDGFFAKSFFLFTLKDETLFFLAITVGHQNKPNMGNIVQNNADTVVVSDFWLPPPVKLFLRLSSFFYPKLEIRFGVSSWSRIETSKTTFLKMNKEYYWSELYKSLTCKNKQKKITLFNILEKKKHSQYSLNLLNFFFFYLRLSK